MGISEAELKKLLDNLEARKPKKDLVVVTNKIAKAKPKKTERTLSEPQGNRVYLKTVSQNNAWMGRRFPSKIYTKFKADAAKMLPEIVLPKPPYEVHYKFGLSNSASDIDNSIKSVQDALATKYKFNDRLIYRIIVDKEIVEKNFDYFEFTILHYQK